MVTTAGIVIIGDEILAGRVQDCNSFFIAGELRACGIELRSIVVIPDDIEQIALDVKSFSGKFDYVFTSGGVGPTHDDVTMEGIAKAFSAKIHVHKAIEALLKSRYGENLSTAQRKMAKVPVGSELFTSDDVKFPVLRFKNIYILPGIPRFLRQKFTIVRQHLDKTSLFLKKIYVNDSETQIAALLTTIATTYSTVKIGSYPVLDQQYRVLLTFESRNQNQLQFAVQQFTDNIAKEKILKIE